MQDKQTPYYVFDEQCLRESLTESREMCATAGCQLLYSLKACSLEFVLETIRPYVQGYACSSPFEAKWAHSISGPTQSIHYTSPLILPEDEICVLENCSHIAFNSYRQLERLLLYERIGQEFAFRINPELSFADDDRYDPCRRLSKLGITFDEFRRFVAETPSWDEIISGVHFHTNCDCASLVPLQKTVKAIVSEIPEVLSKVQWINLGGGYLFKAGDCELLSEIVGLLKGDFGLDVFVEPGSAIVRDAGSLVTSVVDVLQRNGYDIVILDTTVNHVPEVFEYQYEPDVVGHGDDYEYRYLLAGGSCLAGDIFGEYRFAQPLEIGQKLTIANIGSYSTVKMHMFNGINLPAVYYRRDDETMELKRRFEFSDFVARQAGAGICK